MAQRFHVEPGDASSTLAAFLRGKLGLSWKRAKTTCRAGSVRVDGRVQTDPAYLLGSGALVELQPGSRQPNSDIVVLHADRDVVVVDKPPQLLTVPADELDETSLVEELRHILRRKEGRPSPPLRVVHRLDRDTSGILVFARNPAAHRHLQQQFRVHSVERRYLALVYGVLEDATFDTMLLPDRGDGLRGSVPQGRRPPPFAKRAVTHVQALARFEVPSRLWVHGTGLDSAGGGSTISLVSCRLETGRQHQIRIHLSEAGHPVVGERVYDRDYRGRLLEGYAPPRGRTLLHAARLGFVHPRRDDMCQYEREVPEDFAEVRRLLEGAPRR